MDVSIELERRERVLSARRTKTCTSGELRGVGGRGRRSGRAGVVGGLVRAFLPFRARFACLLLRALILEALRHGVTRNAAELALDVRWGGGRRAESGGRWEGRGRLGTRDLEGLESVDDLVLVQVVLEQERVDEAGVRLRERTDESHRLQLVV